MSNDSCQVTQGMWNILTLAKTLVICSLLIIEQNYTVLQQVADLLKQQLRLKIYLFLR